MKLSWFRWTNAFNWLISNAMFLIRFINKYFIQNLEEADLSKCFEHYSLPNSAKVSPSPVNGNGVVNGTGNLSSETSQSSIESFESPVLTFYLNAIIDILIHSPAGYMQFFSSSQYHFLFFLFQRSILFI